MRILCLLLVICFAGCRHNIPAAHHSEYPPARQLAEENNQFAFDLYRQLSPEKDNLLFSPYSLSNALTMTMGGAAGETAIQMERVLGIEMMRKDLFPAFAALNGFINNLNREGEISVLCANGIWAQAGFPFKEDFFLLARQSFNAELRQADFITGHELQRRQINVWVEEKTNDKIRGLLPAGILNAMTRMVLVNAIYFKGDWEMPFDRKRTRDMLFWVCPSGAVPVPMMSRQDEFKYTRDERFQVLELPYAGKTVSMLILLPDKQDGLKAVENLLTAAYINDLYGRLSKQKVSVFLPRFKIAGEFGLSETLRHMGMTDAFDNRADFSGMNGARDLHISDVVHKAVIEVDEKGSAAAAATGVVMATKAAPSRAQIFRADHPFIFFIRENNTGTILFLGCLTHPR